MENLQREMKTGNNAGKKSKNKIRQSAIRRSGRKSVFREGGRAATLF